MQNNYFNLLNYVPTNCRKPESKLTPTDHESAELPLLYRLLVRAGFETSVSLEEDLQSPAFDRSATFAWGMLESN